MTANNDNIENSEKQKVISHKNIRRLVIGGGGTTGITIICFFLGKETVFTTIWNVINSWPVVILGVGLSVCITHYKVIYENNVTEREKNDVVKLKNENQDLKNENADLKNRTEELENELRDEKIKLAKLQKKLELIENNLEYIKTSENRVRRKNKKC